MWKCDVCGKTGESPTSMSQLRLMPKGWRWRTGSDRRRNEIEVYVCSETCAKKYDRVEVEEVGFTWCQPSRPELVVGAHGVRPLKVRPLKVK